MKRLSTLFLILAMALTAMAQGWPQNYGGVMLQGFYWNSYDDTQWVTLEKQATDLALLANGMLKGKDLSAFIKRSEELLDQA